MSNISSNTSAEVDESQTGETVSQNLDIAVSEAGEKASATDKNTDAEIRDGVWSDGTKAPGANLDKAISELNDLSQSDILSDGTPFDGSNIDAPISDAGRGVDWSSKTPKRTTKESFNQGESISVTGSGYFIGAYAKEGADVNFVNLQIDIDGTTISSKQTRTSYDGSSSHTNETYFYRFESGFDAINNSTDNFYFGVTYVLD